MNEIVYVVLALIAGLGLGFLFFGGLWLTVKKVAASNMPALWVFGSFLVRVSLTLAGFYFIAAGNWQRLFMGVIGFVAARFMVIHFTKSNEEKPMPLKKEVSHEA